MPLAGRYGSYGEAMCGWDGWWPMVIMELAYSTW